MRFKGEPGMCVFDYRADKLIGKFDSKGYMDVEDEVLQKRFAQQFKVVRQRQKNTKGSENR